MKTKILILFLAIAPVMTQAQLTFTTNSGAVTIIGYNPAAGLNVVIPASTNGYPVTSVGDSAFDNQGSIISVTIPNSVTSIGNYAFENSGLRSVTIPNSVTRIGTNAFSGSVIASVTIGTNVTSIGEGVFAECDLLTSVTIPNSITSIGGDAFVLCTSLAIITIPNSVTNIGEEAFEGCYHLTSVTIPNSVTCIGDSAFYGCYRLDSVTIGNSVTSIGDSAFYECSGLASVTIPNSVTSIGDFAFTECSGLTSVTMGNSVTSIGEQAFSGCSLTSITIPNNVTSIGEYTFEGSGLHQAYFQGNAPLVDGAAGSTDSTVFQGDSGTAYYLPGTTGWGATFGGWPTAPWFLPNPLILNKEPNFGVGANGFGFTISWATNASVVVQACTNLANPVWIPVSTSTLTGGTNYFSDAQWTNYPMRFYRAALAYIVGGTLTGLPAGDTVTLQDNGFDNLTLSTNGTFTFPTALPNGHAYSVTISGTGGATPPNCTLMNGSGTISGANVTNVAVQCTRCPALTGDMALDMYNAAVSDGTANGGVPAVMVTEYGGPFRVTAVGVCSYDVCLRYYPWSRLAVTMGNTSCSSTTFPSNTLVIQFGTALACGQTFGYGY